MRSQKRRAAPLVWFVLAAVMVVPVVLAATSPYLAYRNLPYIVGGFAGIVCLSLFVIQPLLAAGWMPGLSLGTERRWHRWVGAAIVACVVLHVGGLYIASPPDTLDALMLVSPTPFSVYGVLATWSVAATAVLVALRHRMGLRYSTWFIIHNALALVVVVATVIHALQIEGAMEGVSKWAVCVAALVTTGIALVNLRIIKPLTRWRRSNGR